MNRYRVQPGRKVDLGKWGSAEIRPFACRKDGTKEKTAKPNHKMEELLELRYVERKQRVPVTLQGMDTSGKNGGIRAGF
ncbi:MAG: hypothetical protein IT308_01865 [Anaerolineaceae bacterium]|nr:hypothetical protein [Anaerolineaceae bacterium]